MQKDERDLLEVLKLELKFLEEGGYERSKRAAWRPQLIFEDSPTCMNFSSADNPAPCSDCVLIQLVPPEFRSEQIPCRHIPFGSSGENLDSLYRYGDQVEIEEVVGGWLQATIKRLEEQRAAEKRNQKPEPAKKGSAATKATPLYQKQHPKCANPACPTAFNWTGGGRFLRFRRDPDSQRESGSAPDSQGESHGVKHYWLCERCSQAFTLVHDEQYGVVLKALGPDLAMTEAGKKASAA